MMIVRIDITFKNIKLNNIIVALSVVICFSSEKNTSFCLSVDDLTQSSMHSRNINFSRWPSFSLHVKWQPYVYQSGSILIHLCCRRQPAQNPARARDTSAAYSLAKALLSLESSLCLPELSLEQLKGSLFEYRSFCFLQRSCSSAN